MRTLIHRSFGIPFLLGAAALAAGCAAPTDATDANSANGAGEALGQKAEAILPPSPNWAYGHPADALIVGKDSDGTPLLACRGTYGNSMQPGKTRADWNACDVGFGGQESWLLDYQTLIPAWAAASGGAVPNNAFAFGHEGSGEPLFTCRAAYQGGVVTGKVRPGYDGCFIPYGGLEVHVPSYEVLVDTNKMPLTGVGVSGGAFPDQAIVAGHEADGTPLYLCLGSYYGVHPGKMQKGWKSCVISIGGSEAWISDYQVLVPQMNEPVLNSATHPFDAGRDTSGTSLGVCSADYAGGVQVGKYLPWGACNFGYGGQEVSTSLGYRVLSLAAPETPIFYDSKWILFDNAAAQAWAHVTVNPDGSYVFEGHFHDAAVVDYQDSIVLVLKSASGKAFTFTRSGSARGTDSCGWWCGSARDDDWRITGTNPDLAAMWADLQQYSVTIEYKVGWDFASIVNAVKADVGFVQTVVNVVGAVVKLVG